MIVSEKEAVGEGWDRAREAEVQNWLENGVVAEVDKSDAVGKCVIKTRWVRYATQHHGFADPDDTTVDGFLAHEAQAVVPESVTGTHNEVDDDGNAVMQGIDQSKLVPLLTAALQEAIAKIETLETKVTALENA